MCFVCFFLDYDEFVLHMATSLLSPEMKRFEINERRSKRCSR